MKNYYSLMNILFQNGLNAYYEGRYEDAEGLLRQYIENDDQNDEVWNILGLTLYELGNIEDATICLENALILKPNNGDYKNNLRLIKRKGKKFVIPSISKTILVIIFLVFICIIAYYWLFMSPTSERLQIMGNDLLHEGRYLEAIEAFDKAIEIDKDNYDLWNSKGVTFHKMSNFNDAIDAYDKSIQLNLSNYIAWHNKGVSLYELGRIKEAIAAYDQSLKLNPNYIKSIDAKKIALAKIAPIPTFNPLPTHTKKPTPSPTPTYDLSQDYHMTGRYVDSKSDAMREAEESQKWREEVEMQRQQQIQIVQPYNTIMPTNIPTYDADKSIYLWQNCLNSCSSRESICENSCPGYAGRWEEGCDDNCLRMRHDMCIISCRQIGSSCNQQCAIGY